MPVARVSAGRGRPLMPAIHGPCRDAPDLFGPDVPPDSVQRAKKICRTCPAVTFVACRTYAISTLPDLGGVWGGLTPADRTWIRKHQTKEP